MVDIVFLLCRRISCEQLITWHHKVSCTLGVSPIIACESIPVNLKFIMTTSILTSQKSFVSALSGPLSGTAAVPGDKSISHRSLLLASQLIGHTQVCGLLESEDVLGTAEALRKLGVRIEKQEDGTWHIWGNGIGGLHEPSAVLDMGNSGTGARLMMGLVSSYDFTTFFMGDASLARRPMRRVLGPLQEMGARFIAHSGDTLPLVIQGQSLVPLSHTMKVASAQVKSAIMLAALNTPGTTTIVEPVATRDHTERMMRYLGFAVSTHTDTDGNAHISVTGHQPQQPSQHTLHVPCDPSSAAFPLVAALLVKDSDVTVQQVCLNPLRTGLFDVLKRMGADLTISNMRELCGEPVGDVRARYRALKGVDVPAAIAPSMIDEYPILAIAAAHAHGTTRMRGLSELRVKESDRLAAIAAGLLACGISAEIEGDDLIVHGSGQAPIAGGGDIITHYDHRIAMSFLVLGLTTERPIHIDDGRSIATSFPGFIGLMNSLGAFITPERRAARRHHGRKPLVIAIDGPAASGKGTLARRLSEHYGLPYLDTGSLYRAVGMRLVYGDKDPHDKPSAIEAAQSLILQDLSNPRLRQERVGQAASIVSAIPEIRAILLDYQRDFAKSPQGAILDGRDIGTVVCPDADLKIFMTASLEARAARRHRELQGEGIEVVYQSVLDDLIERDERDKQRQNAPLIAADDAVHVDSTTLSANEVFELVTGLIDEHSKAA